MESLFSSLFGAPIRNHHASFHSKGSLYMLPLMLGQRELFIMFFPRRRDSLTATSSTLSLSEQETTQLLAFGQAVPLLHYSRHLFHHLTLTKHPWCPSTEHVVYQHHLIYYEPESLPQSLCLGLGGFFFSFSSHFFFHIRLQTISISALFWLDHLFFSTCVWEDYIKVRHLNHLKWIKYQ